MEPLKSIIRRWKNSGLKDVDDALDLPRKTAPIKASRFATVSLYIVFVLFNQSAVYFKSIKGGFMLKYLNDGFYQNRLSNSSRKRTVSLRMDSATLDKIQMIAIAYDRSTAYAVTRLLNVTFQEIDQKNASKVI